MSENKSMDIDYVAKLARIALTGEERERFGAQLQEILEFFERLKAYDVSGVEPTAHAMPVFNVWREDVAQPGLTVDEALRNAPSVRAGQVVVPRVVDDS